MSRMRAASVGRSGAIAAVENSRVLYEFALFFHLLGAFVFFSGIGVASVAFLSAGRRVRPSEIALLLALSRVGVALVALGSVLVLGLGLWLLALGDHSLREPWLAAAPSRFVASVFWERSAAESRSRRGSSPLGSRAKAMRGMTSQGRCSLTRHHPR